MEAAFRSLHLWDYAGGVVCAELGVADTAGPGAYGIGRCFETDGFEAGWIIGSDG